MACNGMKFVSMGRSRKIGVDWLFAKALVYY